MITWPPVAAAPLSVTIPTAELPPVTVAGLKLIEERAAGSTIKVADFDEEPVPAVMIAVVNAPTPEVLTGKLTEAAAGRMTTEDGVVTLALFDERTISAPYAGAGFERVTVAIEATPPITDAGFRVTLPMETATS